MTAIYTIGHSNHEPETFIGLLDAAGIDTIVDIRSNPVSKWATFANKDNLRHLLSSSSIKYSFMGDMLGGHPSGKDYYDSNSGKVNYERIAESESFKKGIDLLVQNSSRYHICIMCAEENPANCHRSLLVAQELIRKGVTVKHIRGDGRIQSEEDLIKERAKVPENQSTLPLQ